jgi:RNA recognition motif-containing protein
MVGDLPFANVRPPENVLFVCKLNPVTRDEDLELIFSRFGPIMSCQVIRDKKTGDSLQYAFIEFDKREDAEQVRDMSFIVPYLADAQVSEKRPISRCRTFSWTIVVYGLTCMCSSLTKHLCRPSHFLVAHNRSHVLTKAGPITQSERVGEDVVT